MKTSVLLIVVLATGLVAAAPALASWAWLASEDRIVEADVVVVGKITAVREGFEDGNRKFVLGEIQVAEVLKGDKKLKKADLAWTQPMRNDGDIGYSKDQEGVWILRKHKDKDCYTANYPSDYQKSDQKDRLAAIARSLESLAWGKAVDGLQLSLAVRVSPTSAHDGDSATLRLTTDPLKTEMAKVEFVFLVKNTSDKPLRYCNWLGDPPCSISLTTPTGKPEIDLYPHRDQVKGMKLTAENFALVGPGQTRVAYRWTYDLTDAGTYKATGGFAGKQDGKDLGVESVWTNKLESSPLTVEKAK